MPQHLSRLLGIAIIVASGTIVFLARHGLDTMRSCRPRRIPFLLRASSPTDQYIIDCNNSCGPLQRCFLGKCHCLAGRSGPDCDIFLNPPGGVIDVALCPQNLGRTPEETNTLVPFDYADMSACNITHKSPRSCAIFCESTHSRQRRRARRLG